MFVGFPSLPLSVLEQQFSRDHTCFTAPLLSLQQTTEGKVWLTCDSIQQMNEMIVLSVARPKYHT